MKSTERDGVTPKSYDVKDLDAGVVLGQLIALKVRDGDMVVLRLLEDSAMNVFDKACATMGRVKEILGYKRLVIAILSPEMTLERIPRKEAIQMLQTIVGENDDSTINQA